MDSIATRFSFSHQPRPGVPVFDPAPGTVQNTEAMYQFACTLRGSAGIPAGDTPLRLTGQKRNSVVGRADKGEFDTWFELFCSQVGDNKKLHALHLTVSDCGLTGTEASCLAGLACLTSLDISDNNLGVAGAYALAALTRLTSLNSSYNDLGVAGAQALVALTRLTSLDISRNELDAEGARALVVLTRLTLLDIGGNQLGAAGAQALVAALPNLTLNQ